MRKKLQNVRIREAVLQKVKDVFIREKKENTYEQLGRVFEKYIII